MATEAVVESTTNELMDRRERKNLYNKNYRLKNKEKIKEYFEKNKEKRQDYLLKNKEKRRMWRRVRYLKNIESEREKSKLYMREIYMPLMREELRVKSSNRYYEEKDIVKQDVFSHYSKGKPACNCCGEVGINFLTIDHINGLSEEEKIQKQKNNGKRKGGFHFYRKLKSNNYPGGFQVLCYNCNTSKGIWGACPHSNLELRNKIEKLDNDDKIAKFKVVREYSSNSFKCECCGNNEYPFLTADHIGGIKPDEKRGKYWRKYRTGAILYKQLINNNYPSIIQILCMNCNFAKRNNAACPHSTLISESN